MINMYSTGMMFGGGYNVHSYYKNKYGVAPTDFAQRPYVQPYPMPYIPRTSQAKLPGNKFVDFLRKIFC